MAEGRRRENWDHTASVLCLTANVNRDPKKAAFRPVDFHPFMQRMEKKKVSKTEQFNELKSFFVKRKK